MIALIQSRYDTMTYVYTLKLYLPPVVNKVVHSRMWIFSIQVYYVIKISKKDEIRYGKH